MSWQFHGTAVLASFGACSLGVCLQINLQNYLLCGGISLCVRRAFILSGGSRFSVHESKQCNEVFPVNKTGESKDLYRGTVGSKTIVKYKYLDSLGSLWSLLEDTG